jgi:soluble calcium-activated nucleotidase 1
MELSEVIRFRHNLLALCDITGLVWKVRVADGSIFQRYAIADGNGEVPKPCKIEWATRKDGHLMVGSVGKSFLDDETGQFINRDSEWIKVISASGRVENSDWGAVYAALRRAAGVEMEGYLWHEAIEWDALSRRWIVMPRKRALRTPFGETANERKGTNIILVADEGFRHIEVKTLGEVEEDWGTGTVRRVPGQRNVFATIKTREIAGVQHSVRTCRSCGPERPPWHAHNHTRGEACLTALPPG